MRNYIKEVMVTKTICLASLTVALSLTFAGCKGQLSYPQVATGQIILYDADGAVAENINPGDALYGQDAHYLAGAAMSYKNNGDGTITDLNTGLTWQMIPVNQGFSWQDAYDYCENLELAGYDDWRMPSAKELFSISDFSTGWPYINQDYFELINNNRIGKDEQYWTNNLYVGSIAQGGNNSAFGVNHGTGHIKAYSAGNSRGGGQRQQGEGESKGDSKERSGQSAQSGQSGQRQQGEQASQGEKPQSSRSQGQGDSKERSGQSGQSRQSGQSGQRQQGEQASQGEKPQSSRSQGQGDSKERSGQSRQSGQSGQRQQGEQASQGEKPQSSRSQGQSQGQGESQGQQAKSPMQKYVRAVRGNVYGINNFSDNGNETITDKATGLMWSKNDSKEGMDWVAALQYAENSELAGYDDWRLPNVKELQGILCYNYAPNAREEENMGAAIDPIFFCSEIINENGDKDYPYFWSGTSALFQKGRPYYYAWYVAFGRAVSPGGTDSHGAGAVRFDTKHEGGPLGEDKARYYNYVRLVRNI